MQPTRMFHNTARTLLLAVTLAPLPAGFALAGDWPMWRFDGRRSAATTEQLADQLHPQWSIQQPAPREAWPEDPRLHFDASLEPIVAGGSLLLVSSRNDSLTSFDTHTGKQRWRFFADGPIRFAPVAADENIYFGADDGSFYCVKADNGSLLWKFRAAPSERRVIGNERLISAWPLRGGPVLAGDRLYFTAGIWPFEGAQLFELKLDDPAARPTRAAMLPEKVTPQGYLAAEGARLFVPSGRDTAAAFDTTAGKFITLSYQSRGKTDYHVTAQGDYLLHGDRIFDSATGKLLPNVAQRPITTPQTIFGTSDGNVVAYDLANPELTERKDRKGIPYHEKSLKTLWSIPRDALAAATKQGEAAALSAQLVAGDKLYGIHGNAVFAVKLPDANAQPVVCWTSPIEGTPSRLIAAEGRLFVATREGRLLCFGGETVDEPPVQGAKPKLPEETQQSATVSKWLSTLDDKGGYCLVVGAMSQTIIDELVRQSQMHVLVLDPDAARVDDLRRRYDALELYGTRVSALVGTPRTAMLPPYVLSLAVCESPATWNSDPSLVEHVYRSLRPYGGRVILGGDEVAREKLRQRVEQSSLEQAELTSEGAYSVLTRAGALPGAADWTHEYGDSSNSLMSQDQRVKAPLGVLWFGGPASASELFFNRHYWPPSLTVNQGRMFFQGPEVFVAVDIYTGRVLWKKPLPAGSSPGRRGNFFEKVRVGFHFLTADDAVYLSDGEKCEKLNPATGAVVATFRLERPQARWGTMRIWEDRLICTIFLPDAKGEYQPEEIVSIDRHTGAEIWRHEAELTVPVAALGGDQVFVYDGVLDELYDSWKRRGLVPKSGDSGYLKALDIRTGKQIWKSGTSRAVTWLAVSPANGVLVASNKKGLEGWDAKSGQALWDKQQDGKGFLGHPEELWDKVILWNDRIIDQRGPGLAYNVKSGEPLMQDHPLSGESVPWEFTKTGHHCNYAIGSPHLLTFRADTAGFLDLESGMTGRLNGFRSGCRNSLIPAGGVLNAPNFAHGCICSYSLFTSLALVHTPDADVWAYNAYQAPSEAIQRVGINLGAPGDRQDENGTLWLDYPSVGGPSPQVKVTVAGSPLKYFRGPSLAVEAGKLAWVAASGCEGLSSIDVQLGGTNLPRTCRVSLVFCEPEDVAEGERVFDVAVQDELVLREFDILRVAGGKSRMVVRSFDNVPVKDAIRVHFTPRAGQPLLCGIEIVAAED